MPKSALTLALLLNLALVRAQQPIQELNQLAHSPLFKKTDTTCFNLSGEWTGEEIQYDRTKSFKEAKFKISFQFKQEGNRVFGTSFIKNSYTGSSGEMKIRGIVEGDKFYFEEFELLDNKMAEKNMVWCLRSGEMKIIPEGTKTKLESIEYKGYGAVEYDLCDDHSEMSLERVNPVKTTGTKKELELAAIEAATKQVNLTRMWNNQGLYELKINVNPNPCLTETTLSFELTEDIDARLDIYSFSGAHIATLADEKMKKGKHSRKLDMSAYTPGVYLVTMRAAGYYCTRQIVKSKT